MWPGLWVLDWEPFRSMAGGAAGVPSELLEALEGVAAFPAPFEAVSGSMVNDPRDGLILLSLVCLVWNCE